MPWKRRHERSADADDGGDDDPFRQAKIVEVGTIAVPTVGDEEALIRKATAGRPDAICSPRGGRCPIYRPADVLGHQVDGRLVALGERIDAQPADVRVMLMILTGCGKCATGGGGNQTLCLMPVR